ncbi:MAG: DUF5317 family protein [Gaiellales bacterium]
MILAFASLLGVCLGLLIGGRLERLAALRLRWLELIVAAFVLQIVAFPFPWLPWRTDDRLATGLWLVSFGLVAIVAWCNRGIVGVPVFATGLGANVLAVGANGGQMPALPRALAAANEHYVVSNNSKRVEAPQLSWLVDRFAVPDWMPVGNVYSVGDVLIALGVVVIVVVAMGTGVPRPRRATLVDEALTGL